MRHRVLNSLCYQHGRVGQSPHLAEKSTPDPFIPLNPYLGCYVNFSKLYVCFIAAATDRQAQLFCLTKQIIYCVRVIMV